VLIKPWFCHSCSQIVSPLSPVISENLRCLWVGFQYVFIGGFREGFKAVVKQGFVRVLLKAVDCFLLPNYSTRLIVI